MQRRNNNNNCIRKQRLLYVIIIGSIVIYIMYAIELYAYLSHMEIYMYMKHTVITAVDICRQIENIAILLGFGRYVVIMYKN